MLCALHWIVVKNLEIKKSYLYFLKVCYAMLCYIFIYAACMFITVRKVYISTQFFKG